MIEEFILKIPNNTEVIGISIVVLILLIVSFIKKIEKLAVVTLIGLIIYAVYIYYTGKGSIESPKEILEIPEKIINK